MLKAELNECQIMKANEEEGFVHLGGGGNVPNCVFSDDVCL